MASKQDFTQLLNDLNAGKVGAEEALLPMVYDELRALAKYYMRDERSDHTLQTTALVHEAYIKMGGLEGEGLENKAHYMRVAARAMRRVLIDHARRKQAGKHGGGRRKQALEQAEVFLGEPSIDLIALDESLEKLGELDPSLTQVVELRFFGGLTAEETAKVLGVSVRKVMYDWRIARAWLKQGLED
ncbi:MAG: sigma-70 family RNA polymerase sigma factor [Planctomycetota bacterium]|jgi:RNA polymerase sigma factor (TIGR02999 family)